jgi:ABC-2 type transport system permease protein
MSGLSLSPFMSKAAKYTAFFKSSFKSQMVYRLATVIGIIASALFLFMRWSLWKALVGSGVRQGVTLQDLMAYVAITEAVLALTYGNFANEIGVSIRDGSVIMHFLRPVSYQLYLLSSLLGRNCYRLFTAALPVVLLCGIIIGLPLPPSIPHFLVFLALVLLGVLIMFQLIYITGLLAFWTQATWYLSWYMGAGLVFFGGSEVPLWFYPPLLAKLTFFLPFRYISFEGINYYLGKLSLGDAGRSLGMAALWWLLLFGIGQFLWMKVRRKMTINGG